MKSRLHRGLALSCLALLAAVSCLVVMAATVPAPFLAEQAGLAQAKGRVSGTFWRGEGLLSEGHRLRWQVRGWQSLWHLALVADVTLAGPGTDLAGSVALRPARATLRDLAGSASWLLVQAVLPDLPLACDARATLATASGTYRADKRGLTAEATAPAGTCTRPGGPPVPHPALALTVASGEAGIVARLTDTPGTELARLTLTAGDRLRITITQAGARLVPGMPASADSQLDLPLALVLPQIIHRQDR